MLVEFSIKSVHFGFFVYLGLNPVAAVAVAAHVILNVRQKELSAEMQKAADAADISVLFFSTGANFWAILGHFWAILAILGHFWANLGNFGSFLGYFG